ncbi:cell wall-binding repeat-containing protein [Clostridium senegalense]|uniref:cell wall-binding repeat-containing protein n=1 Tax=Clostridium senegalense TaxID=1465809 RepID=UPI001C11E83D|nr:cell wall-binding repeat-containing protein [Clostridium senegalense]MBU5227728.1 cell wall-binding repeat-containing protein [Clostridium senegalense]
MKIREKLNYKRFKKASVLSVVLTLIIGSIFSTVAIAKENHCYEFETEISKYNDNYEVTTEPLGLEIGETIRLRDHVISLGGDEKDEFIWLSSDSNMVVVDAVGNVTAKQNGTAKIYCIVGDAKVVFTIIIKDYNKNNLITNFPRLNDNPKLRAASGKLKVFVDPGHGGTDSGAIGPTGYKEKEMTLDVGLRLKSKLEAKGIIVEMSRTTDVELGPTEREDLMARANMGNKFGGDIFVSIHNNSAITSNVKGSETYIHDSFGPGIDDARDLATKIQNSLVNNLGSVDRGVKSFDYCVLRETYMPAILAEIDFINNPIIEAKMKTPEYREMCSQALYDGIINYFNLTPGNPIPVQGITLSDKDIYLTEGYNKLVTANVQPANASNKNVTWTSSNNNIATVDNDGNIKAISEGEAVITATTENGEFKAYSNVKVVKGINGYRLFGSDRYETSFEISKQGWKNGQGANVVLASGEDYPDALCAVPLARKYSAPILLTRKNSLEKGLKDEITRLDTKKVFIIGGETVISKSVEQSIKDIGIDVERLGGATRYETSVLVGNKIDSNGEVTVANGLNYPDALSIAAIAANKNMPILLTDKSSLNDSVKSFIKNKGFTKSYVVGGTTVISDELVKQLPNAIRISGNNRYETNKNVISTFSNSIDFSKVYVAVGNNYPDALSAAPLAAKEGNIIILGDTSNTTNYTIIDAIGNNYKRVNDTYILGSSKIISDGYLNNNGIVVK